MASHTESTPAALVWPVTVSLRHPIPAHGEEVSELTLREPTLAMLDDIHVVLGDEGLRVNLGDLSRLIGAMADIPPSSARQIRVMDLGKFKDVLGSFFGTSPATGES